MNTGWLNDVSLSWTTLLTDAEAGALARWYRRRAEQHYQVLFEFGHHQRVFFPAMRVRFMGSYVKVPDAAKAFQLPPADHADGARLLL